MKTTGCGSAVASRARVPRPTRRDRPRRALPVRRTPACGRSAHAGRRAATTTPLEVDQDQSATLRPRPPSAAAIARPDTMRDVVLRGGAAEQHARSAGSPRSRGATRHAAASRSHPAPSRSSRPRNTTSWTSATPNCSPPPRRGPGRRGGERRRRCRCPSFTMKLACFGLTAGAADAPALEAGLVDQRARRWPSAGCGRTMPARGMPERLVRLPPAPDVVESRSRSRRPTPARAGTSPHVTISADAPRAASALSGAVAVGKAETGSASRSAVASVPSVAAQDARLIRARDATSALVRAGVRPDRSTDRARDGQPELQARQPRALASPSPPGPSACPIPRRAAPHRCSLPSARFWTTRPAHRRRR